MSESMKDRLRKIKQQPIRVRQPLSRDELGLEPVKKLISPESVYMKKVEKVISKHAETKRKMLSDTGQYLSLYHELKKAEDDFLALLDDPDVKFLELPDVFVQKVRLIRDQITNKRK